MMLFRPLCLPVFLQSKTKGGVTDKRFKLEIKKEMSGMLLLVDMAEFQRTVF